MFLTINLCWYGREVFDNQLIVEKKMILSYNSFLEG